MAKVLVELINTCPSCDQYERMIKEVEDKYPEAIDTKIYYAGKDFDYVKKYGVVMKGTMIINGKKKIDNLSKDTIEKAIREAVEENK
ncbi:MAG: thioredoxin family protein [Clostridiaceae bacterium]|nr:thioredoxin family protein [Clostridiaceae bacterium]